MRIKDREFSTFIGEAEIASIVERVAAEVNRDYEGRNLVVCPILTGAFMFASDLVPEAADYYPYRGRSHVGYGTKSD